MDRVRRKHQAAKCDCKQEGITSMQVLHREGMQMCGVERPGEWADVS